MRSAYDVASLDAWTRELEDEDSKLEYLKSCPWLDKAYDRKYWRHSIHAVSSYPSKLPPQIAHHFIRLLSQRGDVVLDPMAGSGTIPAEACLMGRRGIGVDLSPYAHVVTSAKVHLPDPQEALARVDWVWERAPKSVDDDVPPEAADFFHPRTLEEILRVRAVLVGSDNPLDILLLGCLCGILHGLRPGFLSRRSRDIIPIKPQGPFVYKELVPRLKAKVERVFADPVPESYVEGEAHLGDSRELSFLREKADLVLTSPPFFATTEFVRHNWLRLWLLGWSPERQKEEALKFVGEKSLGRFEEDMERVVRESTRRLRSGGYLAIHGGRDGRRDLIDVSLRALEKAEGMDVRTVFEENTDIAWKHALRQHSGERHRFLIALKS